VHRRRPGHALNFTVGILGAAVGIHWSLGFSSVALCLGTLAAGIYALRDRVADAA